MYRRGTGPARPDDPEYTHLQETVGLYSLFIRALLLERGKPLRMPHDYAKRLLIKNFNIEFPEEDGSVVISMDPEPTDGAAKVHGWDLDTRQ